MVKSICTALLPRCCRLSQGVPLRIEVGPRDVALSQVVAVRRDSGDKAVVGLGELVERARGLLDDIHSSMFSK